MERVYTVNESKKYDLWIKFQEHEFSVCFLLDYFYDHEVIRGQVVEVLPSIYCKRKTHFPKFERFENKILHTLENWCGEKNSSTTVIICRNIRDKFEIIDKSINAPSKPDYKTENITTKNEYVATSALPFPDMLGGECIMWKYFRKIGLYDSHSSYQALSSSQVLEVTANNKDLNEHLCRQSSCNDFIEKMLNNTFIPIYKDQDSRNAITIDIHNGEVISLGEGKHRVCAAKRFNIDKIPATVNYITQKKVPNRISLLNLPPWKNHDSSICESILTDCRNIYHNLGLSDEAIHELNETISDQDYISFIEEKTGKNVLEWYY